MDVNTKRAETTLFSYAYRAISGTIKHQRAERTTAQGKRRQTGLIVGEE
jgi:hypothetical protein